MYETNEEVNYVGLVVGRDERSRSNEVTFVFNIFKKHIIMNKSMCILLI